MARSLPPLNALRAFESAGRHLSFTKAAAELNVTPAAVSHQIKALEERLGVQLFNRTSRELTLTEAGKTALPTLGEGFDKLTEGVDQIVTRSENTILTLSVNPSFGAIWLMPRLDRFRTLYPEIDLRIDGTDHLADLSRDNVDLAIRYGPGGYSDMKADLLFQQVNTPVCSPSLLNNNHPLCHPDDLRYHTLLHVEWNDPEAGWRTWLQAAKLYDIDPTTGPRFTVEHMALQAALDGQGVALIGNILVADDIAAGRLVQPFDLTFSTPLKYAYHLLSKPDSAKNPDIDAFRSWLLEQAQLSRNSNAALLNPDVS